MIRRNGKPTSCEPCRVSKVRCDHAAPVCQRCQSRGLSHRCYYHPAPLTRPKGQSVRTRKSQAQTNPRQRQKKAPSSQLSDSGTSKYDFSSPIGITSKTSSPGSCQFLGSTSYLSVFRETPSWLPSTSHRSLRDEFEHWRTDNAYACARLVRLINTAAFCYDNIEWHYGKSRFAIVPAPLVLNPVRQLQEYIEKSSWDATGGWESLHKRITVASSSPLQLSAATSPDEFYAMMSGENLRWEFVGFMFALTGLIVHGRYEAKQVLDLGNGEKMEVERFTREMMLACNACVEICKQYDHVNDMMVWMRYMHIYLGTEVLGETSERAYGSLGDLVTTVYRLGLHQANDDRDTPFFLLETRKRLLAVVHRTDKNLATLLGRPPRLPHQYCRANLPLDLADADLFLDPASTELALRALDGQGWNTEGRFHPATLIRMRQILSVLREQVLELSLGCTGGDDRGSQLLFVYQACQRTWDNIPDRLRYNPKCWETADTIECVALVIVHLEYLLSVFQLHRIRSKESLEGMKDLLDTSMRILSVLVDLTRTYQHHDIRKNLPCTLLIYGIPAAGALVTELHRHTVANQPLPSLTPRSEVIRTLSYLVSWFRAANMAPSTTSAACIELLKIISRLLDDALDYRPKPQSSSEINDAGATSLTITQSPLSTRTHVREQREERENEFASSELQIVPTTDTLPVTPSLEWGARVDGNPGFELASEGFLSWFDDLDIDSMAPSWFL